MSSAVFADEVVLRDGTHVEGTIVSDTQEALEIRIKGGGTMLLTKRDVVRIEHKPFVDNAPSSGKKKSFFAVLMQLPQNNWYPLRRSIRSCHGTIFNALAKNRIYQFVSTRSFASNFRQQNPYGYYMAVYMCFILIAAGMITFLKSVWYALSRVVIRLMRRFI
jgi:hypothetical protein